MFIDLGITGAGPLFGYEVLFGELKAILGFSLFIIMLNADLFSMNNPPE